MTRISKIKLQDDVLEKLFILFFEVVGKKYNKDEFQKVIRDLLSPVERIMIAKRIAIVYLLLKAIDHRVICNVLRVSSATVSRYNLLLEKSEGIVPAFKSIIASDKIQLFLQELFNVLFPPGTYGVNWKSAWQRKLSVERKKIEGL